MHNVNTIDTLPKSSKNVFHALRFDQPFRKPLDSLILCFLKLPPLLLVRRVCSDGKPVLGSLHHLDAIPFTFTALLPEHFLHLSDLTYTHRQVHVAHSYEEWEFHILCICRDGQITRMGCKATINQWLPV